MGLLPLQGFILEPSCIGPTKHLGFLMIVLTAQWRNPHSILNYLYFGYVPIFLWLVLWLV